MQVRASRRRWRLLAADVRSRARQLGRVGAGELGRLREELLDLVFPVTCPLCGTHAPEACGHELPRRPDPGARCGRCGSLLPEALPDGSVCADCRRDPPAFDGVVSLGDYGEPLRSWLLAFKHGGRRGLAGPLGRALARRLIEVGEGEGLAGRVLVPVPLHPLRRLDRGFDQAGLLAEEVARCTGASCVRALRRTRWTVRQGAPGARTRVANVRDAFAPRGRAARRLAGAPGVLLVDDVVTSGATLSACARVLLHLGVPRVGALVAARASLRPGGPRSPPDRVPTTCAEP